MNTDVLADLLRPADPRAFFRVHWERSHFHVARNDPSLYRDILTLEQLDEYLSRNDIRYPSLRMVRAGKGIPVSEFSTSFRFINRSFEGLIDVDRVHELYRDGASVVLQLTRSSLRGVSDFANRLQKELRFNVEATVYITPPEEQGFTTHYDTHSVLVLQIAGKKRWRIYDDAKHLPLLTETYDTVEYHPPQPSAEIILSPGDLLYVPRGLAHDARAADGEKSVHITIGLFPILWRDLFERRVVALRGNARFRRAPVSSFLDGAEDRFASEWRQMTSEAFSEVRVVDLLRAELAGHLRYQSRDTSGRLHDLVRLPDLHSGSRIRLREKLVFTVGQGNARIQIAFYNKQLVLPQGVLPAIEKILSGAICVVGELQSNLDVAGQIALARRLIVEGFVESAPEN